jgi:RHS repeat-associated protein
VIATVNPLGYRTTFGYDGAGRSIRTEDALGYVSSSVYDKAGRLVASVNPLSHRTTFAYDEAGRRVLVRDALEHRTTSVYDAAGRLIATIDALNQRTTYGYDRADRQIQMTDANGNTATTVYDAAGRPVAHLDAEDRRTTAVYDRVDRQICLMNANAHRATSVYDAGGRKIVEIDPLARRVSYCYDAIDNQIRKHDARGNRITLLYDAADQLVGRHYPDGTRHTFQYDAVGHRVVTADLTGRRTTVYGADSELLQVLNPDGKRISFSYDALARRRRMTVPDGGIFTYTHDAVDRIDHLVNPFGERTTYVYDAAGRRTSQVLANGTRTSYTYNAAGEITKLYNLKSDQSVLSSFTYCYDAGGVRTSVAASDGSRTTWTYDKTYRLTRECRTGCAAFDVTHTYDAAGNRVVKIDSGARTTYAFDGADQLVTGVNASGTTTYSYDAAGNLCVDETPTGARTTNTWDAENCLVQVQRPSGGVCTISYNAQGLRVEKQDSSGTRKFLWDEWMLVGENDQTGAAVATYTQTPTAFGEVVSQRSGGNSRFYHYDALGSTCQLTDASEQVSDSYIYRAYGTLADSAGSSENPFRFVGQLGYYYDGNLTRYYVRARHFCPSAARWTSLDPVGHLSGPNLYEYCHSSPTLFVDPTGLQQMLASGYKKKEVHASSLLLGDYHILTTYSWQLWLYKNQEDVILNVVIDNCDKKTLDKTETTLIINQKKGVFRQITLETATSTGITGGAVLKGFSIQAQTQATKKSGMTFGQSTEKTIAIQHKVPVAPCTCDRVVVKQKYDKYLFTGTGKSTYAWTGAWWGPVFGMPTSGVKTWTIKDTAIEKRWKDDYNVKTTSGTCSKGKCTFPAGNGGNGSQ